MAMEGAVWHSGVMSSGQIGDKQGLATKWFGREWDAPTFIAPEGPPGKLDEIMRNVRGEPLPREAFPEAVYVFDQKRFEKIGDLFAAGGFYAAKGKLAQVLAQFDLGQGGLIPFPIYQEDKVTPVAGDFHIWSFGAQKKAFPSEPSPKIRPFGLGGVSTSLWNVGFDLEDGDTYGAIHSCDGRYFFRTRLLQLFARPKSKPISAFAAANSFGADLVPSELIHTMRYKHCRPVARSPARNWS